MIADERYCATFCEILDLLQKLGVEGELAWEHEVEDYAQTKCVYFFIVFLGSVDLRCNEARSSCKFLFRRQFYNFILEDTEAKID